MQAFCAIILGSGQKQDEVMCFAHVGLVKGSVVPGIKCQVVLKGTTLQQEIWRKKTLTTHFPAFDLLCPQWKSADSTTLKSAESVF